MRKVIYSEYKILDGDNHYTPVEVGSAVFHQFGTDYEELEHGVGNVPVAILELDDGQVITVCATMIKFIK